MAEGGGGVNLTSHPRFFVITQKVFELGSLFFIFAVRMQSALQFLLA